MIVALGLIPGLAFMQGNIVTMLRKPAGVPYPNAYATPQQVKESPAAYKFNCAQRSHGNLLENMAQTMLFILFAGLEYPKTATWLGTGWVVARALYTFGYITSSKNGSGRLIGSWFWLMQLSLLGLSCYSALNLL